MRDNASPVHSHVDIDYPTAEPHLIKRAANGVRRFFSVAVAAYDAADQYRQLAKASPNDLIARGDLNRDVFKILVGRR
jgi:hypothetical protein